jgi:threonine/homoserine/homoserine lactone efflux protein
MELLSLFLNSFVVGFSGAMMPGPLLAVDIANTPRHGWHTGPVLSIGHAIAEIGVVLVLALGVAALAQSMLIRQIIGVVGGAALILMGAMMAYDIIKNRVNYEVVATDSKSNHKLAGEGIMATLSNPFWFVWWATTGLAFVVKSSAFGWIGPVVFYFGHILSDFVWYTVVSVLLWTGRKLIMGVALRGLILACALFLLYLGGKFIHDGWTGTL